MLDVNLEKFWEADEKAHLENTFYEGSPQVALGIRMNHECVFPEINAEGDPWGYTPNHVQNALNKRYNDKAEKIVGKRLLRENLPEKDMLLPEVKKIGEVFGGRYEISKEAGEWLHSDITTEKQLEDVLDRVDKLDLREFILPNNWESEKKRVFEKYGLKPKQFRAIRGPVTLAMSIFGVENLIYLHYDSPELYKRFSDSIAKVAIEMAEIMDIEAGYTKDNAPGGFHFSDDNCCMLTAEMYEEFGYPVLKSIFDRFSPNLNDQRYQHSDSEMAHLLPVLSKLNFTGCNFGPTVLVPEIRKYMKNTRIDGCIAPFTFLSNDQDAIIAEVKRDCEDIKKEGTRGLNITTAGSINFGTTLESMRAVMYAIQVYGQY